MTWFGRKKDEDKEIGKREHRSPSQGQMIWRAFRKHRLGNIGMVIVIILVVSAVFAEFIAPYILSLPHLRFTSAVTTGFR